MTLDPPEVVGTLGDDLLVNCTTSEESPEAVSWMYDGIENTNEDGKNFHTLVLPLSQWNTSARCTVKLNETLECSKGLKITMYSKCGARSIHRQRKRQSLLDHSVLFILVHLPVLTFRSSKNETLAHLPLV